MTESERLIDDVMVRGTIGDRSFARAVVEGVLDAVAAPLGPEDRSTVARRLPGPFAAVVRRPSPDAATQPSVLCARLSHREKISLGLAFEHMKSACAAVADRLDGHGRSVLVRRLAPEWSALFILPVARAEPGRGSSTSSVQDWANGPIRRSRDAAGAGAGRHLALAGRRYAGWPAGEG